MLPALVMKNGTRNPEFFIKKYIAESNSKKLSKTLGESCPTYG